MYEQTHMAYGSYQEEQFSNQQQGNHSQQKDMGEKVYASRHDSKNMLRFALAAMSLVTMIIIAVFCMLSAAGGVGWIGFGMASIGIFLITVVAIDKIQ